MENAAEDENCFFPNVDYTQLAGAGTGMSKMAMGKRLVAELQRRADAHGNNLFTHQQLVQISSGRAQVQ